MPTAGARLGLFVAGQESVAGWPCAARLRRMDVAVSARPRPLLPILSFLATDGV